MSIYIRMMALAMPLALFCAASASAPHNGAARCTSVSVGELSRNPARYQGRRVCIHGFLGRMEPVGEESVEVYATRSEAETKRSDYYVEVDISLGGSTQRNLSLISLDRIVAEGTFDHRAICGD